MQPSSPVEEELLGSAQYHIEFNGYLSNHAKHAVVALAGLQAPPERIRGYWDHYTSLTPYGLKLEPAESLGSDRAPLTEESWRRILGRKAPGDFAALLQFFDSEEQRLGGVDGILKKYGRDLLPGAVGALTHALIHLGWGLGAKSRCMALEGVAYLAYSSVSVKPERFIHGKHPDETSPWQTLLRVAETFHGQQVPQWVECVKADERYSEAAGFRPELVKAGFQWSVAKVVTEGHPLMLEPPAWLDCMEYGAAVEELYKALTAVYLSSTTTTTTAAAAPAAAAAAAAEGGSGGPRAGREGNFLLLHLLTSMWGLEQVMEQLQDDADRRFALKCFWAAVVALLITSGRMPSAERLDAAQNKYRGAHDAQDNTSGDDSSLPEGQGWEEIVRKALEEEEEHNIKLVYVGRELWRRYDRWSGFRVAASTFTETPNIGPKQTAYTPS